MPYGSGSRNRRVCASVVSLIGCLTILGTTLQITRAQTAPATMQAAPQTPGQRLAESRFSRSAEAEITFQEGKLLYQSNQLADAENRFKEVVKADPADAEGYYFLGLAQLDQSNSTEALKNFDQSVRLDPTLLEVRAARARANIRAGNYGAAREDLDRLAPNPRWAGMVSYLRGQLAYSEGNLDLAAAEFKKAKGSGAPEAEPAGFYEGLTYLRMRELVRAQGSFREASIDPDRDPTVAAAARQLDAVLTQQQTGGPTRPWQAQLTLSYEYDSNVIQLGSNTAVPDGISDQSDSRFVVQPSGSYSFFRNDKIDAGIEAIGYFTYQFDLHDFDIASYQAGPYVNYKVTDNVYASARYAYNYIQLGHETYLNRHIVTPQLTILEKEFGYTSIYYQFQARQFDDEFDPPESADDLDRDGQTHTLGITQGINTPEIFAGVGKSNLEINYRLIDQETKGSDYDGIFNQVGFTFYTPLPLWRLRGDFGAAYEYGAYKNGNSLDDPTGAGAGDGDKRRDHQFIVTAGLTRQLFKGCTFRVDYNYTNNDSNVDFQGSDVFSYDRHQVGVRLIYSF